MVRSLLAYAFAYYLFAPIDASAADCPVHLRSIVFGAQSSSHDFVTYAVRLSGPPQTGTNVDLSVTLADGKTVDVPWSDVTIEKPANKDDETTAFGTFDRRSGDVEGASVDAVSPGPGLTPMPCDSPNESLDASDNDASGPDACLPPRLRLRGLGRLT